MSLNDRQKEAALPVTILNDDLPEFYESFTVRLAALSISGGAQLGSPVECVVGILENDYPYGLVGEYR